MNITIGEEDFGPVIVQLVGPMRDKPDWNYPVFDEVEAAWLKMHPNDRVINPANNFERRTDLPFETYMAKSLEQIREAHFVILLPGWEDSEGSGMEVDRALIKSNVQYYRAVPCEHRTVKIVASDYWDFEFTERKDVKEARELAARNEAADKPMAMADGTEAGEVNSFIQEAFSMLRDESVSPREALLKDSIAAICGDRNNAYGPPTQDFQRTADLANAWGFRVGDEPLKSHHVAVFMELLKLSRIRWSPEKEDHWLDTAGYAGCGWECVVEEGKGE